MNDSGPHLDLDALQELKLVMGEDFSLLIDTFISDSNVRIDSISQAVATADSEELRRSAHSFKGSASNLGALRLTALCRQLEEMGREQQIGDAAAVLEAIEAEYETVREQLSAL